MLELEGTGIVVKRLRLAFAGLVMSGSLACSGWLGCSASNEADATASVQRAVEKHLAARTDMDPSNLQVVVEKVSYEGDHANAAVTIMARKDPQAKMQMTYRLRKTGAGWEVEPQQGSGAHGQGTPVPQAEETPELPPGHPPLKGSESAEPNDLPPGHPPVGGAQEKPGSRAQ
jgi:hypothetical protein